MSGLNFENTADGLGDLFDEFKEQDSGKLDDFLSDFIIAKQKVQETTDLLEVQKAQAEIAETSLISAMKEQGTSVIGTDSFRASITDQVFASTPKEFESEKYEYLEEEGLGHLITKSINYQTYQSHLKNDVIGKKHIDRLLKEFKASEETNFDEFVHGAIGRESIEVFLRELNIYELLSEFNTSDSNDFNSFVLGSIKEEDAERLSHVRFTTTEDYGDGTKGVIQNVGLPSHAKVGTKEKINLSKVG